MNAFWNYFWPAIAAGIVIGFIAGLIAFRAARLPAKTTEADVAAAQSQGRGRRIRVIIIGALVSVAAASLWHGPLGAADRFVRNVEQAAHQILLDNDAPAGMTAQIHHAPLTRQMILSGPGNDFQRAESARLIEEISGVSSAGWTRSPGIPLIAQGTIAAVLGFLLGLLLAYLVELRRRYNAQWNW